MGIFQSQEITEEPKEKQIEEIHEEPKEAPQEAPKEEEIVNAQGEFPFTIEIKNSERAYFQKQFNLFHILSQTERSTSYCNFFNDVNLLSIEIDEPHEEETFIKSISFFISEKMKEKTKYYLLIRNEKDIIRNIQILQNIPNASNLKYQTKCEPNLPYESYLELFKYVKRYAPRKAFENLYKNIISQMIEIDSIYYLDLDVFELDKVVEYSKKFPNKIKRLYSFQKEDFDIIKSICDLNCESLIQVPNTRIDLYTSCKNIEIIELCSKRFPDIIPEDFNFAKIKKLKTVKFDDYEDEMEINLLIEYINKCPSLEVLEFSTFCSFSNEFFFDFMKKIKANNLRKFYAEIYDFEDENYDEFFEHFQKLQILSLEEHNSMNMFYSIRPIFYCEGNHIKFQFLEKMMTNYLNGKEGRYLNLNFYQEFNEFYEYFKDKKEILQKIGAFSIIDNPNTTLPFIKEVKIKNEALANCEKTQKVTIGKTAAENGIRELINRIKPEFVKSENPNLNASELAKDVNETQIVFEEHNGKIWMRNKNNNSVFEEINLKH